MILYLAEWDKAKCKWHEGVLAGDKIIPLGKSVNLTMGSDIQQGNVTVGQKFENNTAIVID